MPEESGQSGSVGPASCSSAEHGPADASESSSASESSDESSSSDSWTKFRWLGFAAGSSLDSQSESDFGISSFSVNPGGLSDILIVSRWESLYHSALPFAFLLNVFDVILHQDVHDFSFDFVPLFDRFHDHETSCAHTLQLPFPETETHHIPLFIQTLRRNCRGMETRNRSPSSVSTSCRLFPRPLTTCPFSPNSIGQHVLRFFDFDYTIPGQFVVAEWAGHTIRAVAV